jgi:hypothetical protein
MYLVSAMLILAGIVALGQETDKTQYIKIEGVTLDESGSIVPQAGIYSFKLQRGAASNSQGIFSILSTPGDTVLFTLSGYKPTLLTVPPELSAGSYTTDVHIVRDTLTIEEVIVLPIKTYMVFKNVITQAKPMSPETENMNFNVALVRQQLWFNLGATPGEGYRFTMQQMANECYTKGQLH